MNLDQVTVEIRPRTAWEAVDLGAQMARRWWWPMLSAWLIISLPVLCIALLIPAEQWWASALIIWWLKPLYERPLLHILSRAVFNDLPSTKETLQQLPSFAFKQLFLSLTWRRLSPTRAMDLPVLQLEGLTGARRRERLEILHREDSSPAGWMITLGLALEVFLWVGLLMLVWALIPREFAIEWAGLFFDSDSNELIGLKIILWYCAMALSAPFYTACGFALYLNRRIKLEAWDLEIAFRRITNKHGKSNGILSLASAFALFLSAAVIDSPTAAYAGEALAKTESYAEQSLAPEPTSGNESAAIDDARLTETYRSLDRDTAQVSIQQVMQQPEFSRKETRRSLKQNDEEPDWKFLKKMLDYLKDFKGFVAAASLLEVLLWLTVLALAAFVLYRYRHWLAAQFVRVKPVARPRAKPETLFGMEVTAESLPENIPQSALAFLNRGDTRAALALLYRASLFQLVQRGLDIHDGDTEGECVELMREQSFSKPAPASNGFSSVQVDYFSELTRTWQKLAYGHLNPAPETLTQLCTGWSNCWQENSFPQPTKKRDMQSAGSKR